MNRLHGCIDVAVAEAVYHDNCLSRFSALQRAKHKKKVQQEGFVTKKKMKWFEVCWCRSIVRIAC